MTCYQPSSWDSRVILRHFLRHRVIKLYLRNKASFLVMLEISEVLRGHKTRRRTVVKVATLHIDFQHLCPKYQLLGSSSSKYSLQRQRKLQWAFPEEHQILTATTTCCGSRPPLFKMAAQIRISLGTMNMGTQLSKSMVCQEFV